MERPQFKPPSNPSIQKPEFDPVALLDFADVMENLHSFKEIDIVPKQFVDYIKEDDKKVKTLMEYATGLVAVMEGSLLVYFESIYKYHDNCVSILDYFRKTLAVQIPQSWRNELTKYSGNKSHVLEQVRSCRAKDDFLKEVGTQKYLYIIDLASRILLCYNGEFNQSYSTRLDLVLLGQVADFERELTMLKLIHMRFKKSSIAWHYRKVLFMLALSQQLDKLRDALTSGTKKQMADEDLKPLKQFWARERDRLDEIINKFGRAYKIWEYFIHITNYMAAELESFPLRFGAEPFGQSVQSEVEIFTIETFIAVYEYVRELARKNIHNHCVFVLLTSVMKLLLGLKIDLFMENPDFYPTFLKDHYAWVGEMRTYYKALYKGMTSPQEKDRYKLESLESHTAEVNSIFAAVLKPAKSAAK